MQMNSRDEPANKILRCRRKFLKQICAFPEMVILLDFVSEEEEEEGEKKIILKVLFSPAGALTETFLLIPCPVLIPTHL